MIASGWSPGCLPPSCRSSGVGPWIWPARVSSPLPRSRPIWGSVSRVCAGGSPGTTWTPVVARGSAPTNDASWSSCVGATGCWRRRSSSSSALAYITQERTRSLEPHQDAQGVGLTAAVVLDRHVARGAPVVVNVIPANAHPSRVEALPADNALVPGAPRPDCLSQDSSLARMTCASADSNPIRAHPGVDSHRPTATRPPRSRPSTLAQYRQPRPGFLAILWPPTSKKAAPPPGETASDLPKRGADGTRTHDPLQRDGNLTRLAAHRADSRRLWTSLLWPGPRPRSARCDDSTVSGFAGLSRPGWGNLARSFWPVLVHLLSGMTRRSGEVSVKAGHAPIDLECGNAEAFGDPRRGVRARLL